MGNLDQIVPNLCNFISHDPLWGTIGRYLLHLNYQEIPFWGKVGSLCPSWTKILQPYMSWSDPRFFLKSFFMKVHNKLTKGI